MYQKQDYVKYISTDILLELLKYKKVIMIFSQLIKMYKDLVNPQLTICQVMINKEFPPIPPQSTQPYPTPPQLKINFAVNRRVLINALFLILLKQQVDAARYPTSDR